VAMKRLLTMLAVLALLGGQRASAQLAPPNEAGLTFGHVHLNVHDIEVHKKLFAEQFGGIVVQKGPLTVIKIPGMLIALTQAEPTGSSQGTVMDHFGFKVRNIAEHLQKWRAAGYEVQREFKGNEGFPNAFLMGPDGVKLELQEDTTLPVPVSAYHLHYQLADYLKLRDWYVDTLSLVSAKRGTIESANAPGMNLSFQNSTTPTVPTKGRAIDHVGFEVKNLEAFCKKLEAKGVKFDVPFRRVPAIGLNIAYLTDPYGTYIELTEGYDKY
jgi:catechol 2,3-dioxygenase-like lactoylglutathione lyase family enzyme